ncbi:DUF1697 domain-containing protein [Mangrovimonas aestuarii]|uniref:DUF1697 domain-containing protein n=1 Tax=Mangrovimonas aestuarii TaxID=3018443 RepID=UPI0023791D57|nr:DUF1697 domain-containing protein [Mangrovimonas aestuarii]
MPNYIALIRGINVGGQKKLPMAELREALTKSGLEQVKTYIQTGNVIFKHFKVEVSKLENHIVSVIKERFGYDVEVIVKQPEEIQTVIDNCPFPQEKMEKSYFTILHKQPEETRIQNLQEIEFPEEEFVVTLQCVYLFSAAGYGRAKANNNFFEKKLKVNATSRNYKTMTKLLSLCQDL